jgi:hypothetical protein
MVIIRHAIRGVIVLVLDWHWIDLLPSALTRDVGVSVRDSLIDCGGVVGHIDYSNRRVELEMRLGSPKFWKDMGMQWNRVRGEILRFQPKGSFLNVM